MTRTYEVNVRGREWERYIDAETAGKAKYEYLLDVRDAWPDTTFADLTCHAVRVHPATREEAARLEAEAFNRQYPVGTLLRYWSGLKEGEPTGIAPIRHPATVMCDHAVIWLEGVRSCHSLSHVEAATQFANSSAGGAR